MNNSLTLRSAKLRSLFSAQLFIGLLLCLICSTALAQTTSRRWAAQWITVPGATANGYGVYYFRKAITLDQVPQAFPIRVSGDNRYKFYVNGTLVSLGPARGDIGHWRYEQVDIAPQLQAGENVLAAVVWNDGDQDRPVACATRQTAFILQGDNDAAAAVNTDASWLCIQDPAYAPISIMVMGYYSAGPGEAVDMSQTIANWASAGCDLSAWTPAQPLAPGCSAEMPETIGDCGSMPGWQLQPSPLPQMEMTPERLNTVRLAEGCKAPKTFPHDKTSVTIPANTKTTLILDQEHLTNAYFSLEFSRGRNASIQAVYLEGFYDEQLSKGNRDEIQGKTCSISAAKMMERMPFRLFLGGGEQDEFLLARYDRLTSSGSDHQQWTSLEYRTYRYVQLNIETQDEALVLDDVYGTFTGYPFELNASLDTSDESMQKIFEAGWRTARLCAMETYMDCPYYEQLQYVGDTRIQALISLYCSGDDRLVRNFLYMTDLSRRPEGITTSRYPETITCVIPSFSLFYIGALNDYLMYGNDPDFVRNLLPCSRQILDYFARHQAADGSVVNLPGWNFSDWGYGAGVAPMGADGCSAVMDLQLMLGLQVAAKLEQEIGLKELAGIYTARAERLGQTIQSKYWDEARGLYANRSEHDIFSQHTGLLAILTGLVEGEQAKTIAQKLLDDESLEQCSIYYKYYLHQALIKAGLGDSYMDWLDAWRHNLELGMTTIAEDKMVESSRSDCHAWGASPNIEFLRTVLGMDSDAPGFRKVRIEPHLGDIKKIGGQMPHPDGLIQVSYEKTKKGKLLASVTLPDGITGRFVWLGKDYDLHGGENSLELPAE